jgi:hypothetical protein
MNTTKPEPRMVHTVEQPTAVVHEKVPMSALTEFFGRAFGAVMAAAQAQHAQLAGTPFALYRGMPTQTVDVEAGFPVVSNFANTEGVAPGTLPEADAFEAIHFGHSRTDVRAHSRAYEGGRLYSRGHDVGVLPQRP